MKKQFYIIIQLIFLTSSIFSQRQLMWSDTINNGGNISEYYGNYDGNMIKIDSEKNIYTSSISDSSGYKRIMITKLDSLGNTNWYTLYHSSSLSNDILYSIEIDDSNNVFIGGSSANSANQTKQMVLKFNGINGQLLWSYYSQDTYSDFTANDLKFDSLGNIYVCGKYYNLNTTTYNYNVSKLDPSGNRINYYNYSSNTANYGYPNHCAIDSVGNIYFTAQYKNFSSNSDDCALIKLDENLNQIWIQTYDGIQNGNDYYYDIELDINQNPILTGCSGQGTNNSTVITQKYSSSGTLLFSENFSTLNATKGTGRAITSDTFGNIFVASETDSSGILGFSILKYDSTGILKSHTKMTPNNCQNSFATDIVIGKNYNPLIFGYFTNGVVARGIILELDSIGNIIWVNQTNGPNGSDAAYNSGIVDNQDNIYVCGSIVNGLNNDVIVQKFAKVNIVGLELKNKSINFNLFPNPFTNKINIKSDIRNFEIKIYDSTLKMIYQTKSINENNQTLELENLTAGLYFLKINEEIVKIIKY